MKCIKEDRDIEKRCSAFLDSFKLEVNNKLDNMQAQIDAIKKDVHGNGSDTVNPNKSKNEDIVNQVCNDVKDRMARDNNIVIHNLPESESIMKQDVIDQDNTHLNELCKITIGTSDIGFSTRRLGKRKPDNPTPNPQDGEQEETAKVERPVLVCFENKACKYNFMKNLNKLSAAKAPYNNISVKHDMTVQEREINKKLQEEAKRKNDEKEDLEPGFLYVVRGVPWERKIIKIRKKEKENRQQNRTQED